MFLWFVELAAPTSSPSKDSGLATIYTFTPVLGTDVYSRLRSNELIGQYICVRWGSTHSEFPHWELSKARTILSPLLYNVYMDNLSIQLRRQSIGCIVSGSVENHTLYADDIVLFAPSAKGLQKLLDLSHTYGCNHDIEVSCK